MQNEQIDIHLAGLTIKDFGIAVTLTVRVDVFPIETVVDFDTGQTTI